MALTAAMGSSNPAASGTIDRGRLARRVFADEGERRDLEAIVHPEVARLLAEALEEHRDTDHIVVYDVPLLYEAGLQSMFDVIVVVSAPEQARIERLGAQRGMDADDVRARMAAQISDAKRERAADVVIRNAGPMRELEAEADAAWELLTRRAKL